jgi:hypothetical protein
VAGAARRLTEIAQLGQIEGVDADWRFLPCNGARKSGWPRAGRMLGAAIAKMQADAPILRPDAPIPLQPVL